MMHHTKFLKRCLTQPRLLLQTFLLGTLLTGCIAVMAGFGASMVSAQSLSTQKTHPTSRHSHRKKRIDDNGGDNPGAKGDNEGDNPGAKGNNEGDNPGAKGDDEGKGNPEAKGDGEGNPGPEDGHGRKRHHGAPVAPVGVPVQNNNTGSGTNAAGSKNASAAPVGGAIPVGAIPVGGGGAGGAGGGNGSGGAGGNGTGGGAGRPGLPSTGSDPGNNPLP